MGCTNQMFASAIPYSIIFLLFLPFYMVQMYFQSIFVTAGRGKTGFLVTLAGGPLNIVLDYLLIGILNWNVIGAALATGLGKMLAAIFSLLCFLPKIANRKMSLHGNDLNTDNPDRNTAINANASSNANTSADTNADTN